MRYFAILFGLAAMAAAQSQPDKLLRTGLTSLAAQKFPEADAAFRQLAESEPTHITGLMGVVQVYMAQGKDDDALSLLDAEIAKPPVRPELLVAAGDTAMRARRYDKAIADFQQALAAIDFKSESTFYVHRGTIGGNRVTDSVNALIGQDTTPKGAAGVYLRLSEAWHQKGDDKAALEAIGHAKELLPRDAAVLWNLATMLDAAGQKKEALEAYRGVVEVSPGNALALNNAAYLMAETGGDLYEALRYARRAQMLAPRITQIADTTGWVELKMGWTDDALGTFVRLVTNEPGSPTYRAHLAAALEKGVARSPAIDELIGALRKDPSPENQKRVLTLLPELGKKPGTQ